MNHPPIPPNSEFFKGEEFHFPTLLYGWERREYIALSEPGKLRRLIADHAAACWERMAWEYEWEQNVEDWEPLAADARENTDDWDEWGDQ